MQILCDNTCGEIYTEILLYSLKYSQVNMFLNVKKWEQSIEWFDWEFLQSEEGSSLKRRLCIRRQAFFPHVFRI
jgi:hypothetical protein